MLSICLHLLLESESARSLFISVPASPLSQRRERSAAHGTLSDGFQPVPAVSPANASDPFPSGAVRNSSRLRPASATIHPKLPVLRPRRFPGKPSADSHSAQRCDESAVLRSAACGRSSPSATPITIHTAYTISHLIFIICICFALEPIMLWTI